MDIHNDELIKVHEPDPAQLQVLQTVFQSLAKPVKEAAQQQDPQSVEGHIANRLLLGIATLVEVCRDELIRKQAGGGDLNTVKSLQDLLPYFPESIAVDPRVIMLGNTPMRGELPSSMMQSLGWSIQSDTALDGLLRDGFSDQQLYELGKIHGIDARVSERFT